jgi:hypothetical protein
MNHNRLACSTLGLNKPAATGKTEYPVSVTGLLVMNCVSELDDARSAYCGNRCSAVSLATRM